MKIKTLILFLLPLVLSAQKKTLQVQHISPSIVGTIERDSGYGNPFYLCIGTGWNKDPLALRLNIDSLYRKSLRDLWQKKTVTANGSKTETSGAADSISDVQDGIYNKHMEEVFLYFPNRNLGFLYGKFAVSGPYLYSSNPFILRTEDGGKKWELYLPPIGDGIARNDFFMFNEKQAILMPVSLGYDGKLPYLVSSDGGKTWEQKTVEPGQNQFGLFSVSFTADGTCTLVISYGSGKRENDNDQGHTMVLRSENYGRTFRVLK